MVDNLQDCLLVAANVRHQALDPPCLPCVLARSQALTEASPTEETVIEDLIVIDEAHLASFTEGDRELEDEIAELFVNTARGYIKRMREALKEERPWSAEAHALKGASANLGARRVAALAKKAEFTPPSDDQAVAIELAIEEVETFFNGRRP